MLAQRRKLARQDDEAPPPRLRFVIESEPKAGAERRFDQPAPGAAFLTRSYLPGTSKLTFAMWATAPRTFP